MIEINILWIIIPVGILLGAYVARRIHNGVKEKRAQAEERLKTILPGQWYRLYEILNQPNCQTQGMADAVLKKFIRTETSLPALPGVGMDVILEKVYDYCSASDLLKPHLECIEGEISEEEVEEYSKWPDNVRLKDLKDGVEVQLKDGAICCIEHYFNNQWYIWRNNPTKTSCGEYLHIDGKWKSECSNGYGYYGSKEKAETHLQEYIAREAIHDVVSPVVKELAIKVGKEISTAFFNSEEETEFHDDKGHKYCILRTIDLKRRKNKWYIVRDDRDSIYGGDSYLYPSGKWHTYCIARGGNGYFSSKEEAEKCLRKFTPNVKLSETKSKEEPEKSYECRMRQSYVSKEWFIERKNLNHLIDRSYNEFLYSNGKWKRHSPDFNGFFNSKEEAEDQLLRVASNSRLINISTPDSPNSYRVIT